MGEAAGRGGEGGFSLEAGPKPGTWRTISVMLERRTKRSTDPSVALQYLVEAVADRSEVHAIAVVDSDARIVAGTGYPEPLRDLARLAGDGGPASPRFEEATQGTDYFGCAAAGEVSLVAFGERIPRLPDVVRSVKRILQATP